MCNYSLDAEQIKRQSLQREFMNLRNKEFTRPPSSNTRAWGLYMDHLNDSDKLAEIKSNEELEKAIARMLAAQ